MCGRYATGKREEGGRGAPTRRPNQARGIAQRSEDGGAGRPCGTDARGIARGGAAARSHAPPPERSGAGTERGHYTPRRTASKASGGEGGRGGGGRGLGLRAWAMATTTRLRAQRTAKKRLPEPTSGRPGARSLDGERPEPRGGAYSEVRASRGEVAEPRAFDSQCPLSVACGAAARRHAADA